MEEGLGNEEQEETCDFDSESVQFMKESDNERREEIDEESDNERREEIDEESELRPG